MLPAKVTARAFRLVKNLPAMQETWVRSLGWENPLEKGMAAHSNLLAWRIPWTEEPGRATVSLTHSRSPPAVGHSTGSQFSICAQGVSAVGAGTGPTASRILTQRETGTLTQRSPTCPSPDGNPASSRLPPAEPTGLCAPNLPR